MGDAVLRCEVAKRLSFSSLLDLRPEVWGKPMRPLISRLTSTCLNQLQREVA